jgi:site-specific recombinase XerD
MSRANHHEATALGNSPSTTDQLPIKTLCDLYLDHQESRVATGEIKQRHMSDQAFLLRAFVKFVGGHRSVSDISTLDLQSYRRKLIQAGKSANTINNRIAAVKAMYNWALDNEVIDQTLKRRTRHKVRRWVVERTHSWMNRFRRVLIRWEKKPENYFALVHLVCALITYQATGLPR